jgi:PAS domain S-box-containing protein
MHYHPTKPSDSRQSGIDVIGPIAWGSHFCQFYQTKQDLIDILVPYFKAGLESNEFCMWVTAEPLDVQEATRALRKAVPDLDRRLVEGQMEIMPYTDWYVDAKGVFDRDRVLNGWVEKLDAALAKGYVGLRLTGNTFRLEKEAWRDFTDYEEAINSAIGNYPMIAMCTYSIERCGAAEVADVVANHDFALIKRGGAWSIIEGSTVRQTRQQLQVAYDELENENKKLKKSDELLQRMNRTLKALSSSDKVMMRATKESDYLRAVCRVIVEDCGHAMVWIGYAEDDEQKSVRPVAFSGFEKGYLETLEITWADTSRGRGPTGTAIRTGKPCLCRNMLTDPKFGPWRDEAVRRGYSSSVVVPLMADGKALGAMSIYSREPDPFSEDEVTLLCDLADDLAFGIRAIRLREAHAVATTELAEINEELTAINEELQVTNDELRQEMALRSAAESALRRSEEQYRTLFSTMTEGFALHEVICDEAGRPFDYRFLEVNPAFERLTGITAEWAVGKSVREVIPNIEDHWIKTYGEVALTGKPAHFESYAAELERYFDVVAFSPHKGRFATIFVDSTESHRILERERHISEVLQRALVPDTDYDIPGCTVAVRYEPALEEAEVGGDFYDIFELGDGKLGVLIGDVAGKGLPAAIRVAAARHAIRSYAYLDPRPSEVLRLANNALCRDYSDLAAMLTIFYAVVDTRTGKVSYGSGGHEPAYLRTKRGCVELLEASGRALGVVEGFDYTEQMTTLAPGDTLVLLTDGITEARPRGVDLFGLGGVVEFLTLEDASSPDTIADGLLKAAKLHGGGSLRDDVAIIALRLENTSE